MNVSYIYGKYCCIKARSLHYLPSFLYEQISTHFTFSGKACLVSSMLFEGGIP